MEKYCVLTSLVETLIKPNLKPVRLLDFSVTGAKKFPFTLSQFDLGFSISCNRNQFKLDSDD